MSELLTTADLARVRQSMTLGLARQPLALSEPLQALAAAASPGRDPALTVLALAGQRLRFERPEPIQASHAVPLPVMAVARRLHDDPRPLMPEAPRRTMKRLLHGLDKGLAGGIMMAAGRRVARAGLRLHPFDLPELIGYLENDAACLGLAERAYLALTDSSAEAKAQSLMHAVITAENWTDFPKGHRAGFLREERRKDAAAARVLLEGVFKSEPAPVRGELLEALGTGLSTDDLPFLESLAADRADSVRAIATAIIARVPGTAAYTARLAQAASCFSKGGGMSKLLSKVGLGTETAFKPPKDATAAQLMQLFAGLPLVAVAGTAKLSPRELLATLPDDEHWVFAAFLATAGQDIGSADGPSGSTTLLVEHKLDPGASAPFPSGYTLMSLARHLSTPLSAEFSAALMASPRWQAAVQRFTDAIKDDGTLVTMASLVPAATLPAFLHSVAPLLPGATRSARDFAEFALALEAAASPHTKPA